MKINSKHRVLSIILSVLMVLSLMPVAVFADDGSSADAIEYWISFDASTGKTFSSLDEALTYASKQTDATRRVVISGDYTLSTDISIPDGVYLDVIGHLTISDGVTITVPANAKRFGVWDGGKVDGNGQVLVYGRGNDYSESKVMVNGTMDLEMIKVPEGYVVGNNGSTYFAAKHIFEITLNDGSVKKVTGTADITSDVTNVKLLDNYSKSWMVTKTNTGLVLDLNGFTWGGQLSIANTEVTIKNGTVKHNGSSHGAVYMYGSAVVTIASDAVINGDNGMAIHGQSGKLTVNGTVRADGGYAIAGNGDVSGGIVDSIDIIVNDGAVISAPNGIGIYHPQKGTVTVNGGTITGHTGIEMCSGKLVVNGGTITSTGDNYNATGSQNAILDGAAISLINRNYSGGIPSAEINDGTITASGTNALAIKAYDYKQDNVAEWVDVADYVKVSAGTFSSDVSAYVAADSVFTDNGDGTYSVKGKTYAAEAGGVKYETVAEAIKAVAADSTVTLISDATEDVVIDKNITLDLGGKTLTNTNAGKATISVQNGATVTVTNGTVVGGTSYYNIEVVKGSNANLTLTGVTATAGNTGSSMIDNWGTLTIKSGTYTGGLNVVKSEEGSTLVITGGEFTLNYATDGYTGVIFVYGDTTISGGTFTQSVTTTGRWNHPQVVATGVVEGYTAITRVTGGTFTNKRSGEGIFRGVGKGTSDNFEVSGGTFNKSIPDEYCADGFIPTKNADSTYGVKEGKYVASTGSKNYETLADAIRLAANKNTITLLCDVDENVTVAANKNITIDLKGHTLNGGTGTSTPTILNRGTLTITDSSADKTGTIKRDDAGVEGETSYYVIDNRGTMTIESANVVNNSGYKKTNSSGTMVGSSLIINIGEADKYAVLNIKGGTFTQNNFIAIKNDSCSKLNVSGGVINSKHSAVQNWCNANITGGELNGQLWTDAWKETSTGKTVVSGDAKLNGEIVMDITGSIVPTLEISGGSHNVTWKVTTAAAIAGAKPQVSGGTFKTAVPEDYCADGFIPTQNADGTYGVKTGVYVAQNGNEKYVSLQAAIDAAKAGDNVTLIAGVDVTEQIVINKSITLDLSGYTIRNTADIWDKVNSLILIDGGANVTVTGNGTIAAKENDCYTFNVNGNSTLTIENGTFIGNVSVVQVQSGNLVINGGNFSLLQKWNDSSMYLINCIDDAFASGDAKVAIKGGTFADFDPNVSPEKKVDGKTPSFVAEGVGVAKDESGNFVAVSDMAAQILDADGNSVKAYATLAEAFGNVETGYTVRLLKNITLTEQINIVKALNGLTLDGNGYTITCATTADPMQSGGSALYFGNANEKLYCTGIKINDLTMVGTARYAIFLCGGTSTEFTNVKISGNYYIAVNLYGTHGAVMTNCDISTNNTNKDMYVSAIWSNVSSANPLVLNNTKVSSIAIKTYTTANKLEPKIFVNEGSVTEVHTFDDGTVSGNRKLCVSTSSTGEYTILVRDSDNTKWIPIPQYTVTTTGSPAGAGVLTGGGAYEEGTEVTITATANGGYEFLGWYLNGERVTADTSYTFKASADASYVAMFKGTAKAKLSVNIGKGKVSAVYGGVSKTWRNDLINNSFAMGTSFTLTAVPNAGYRFLYWINSENKVVSENAEYTFILGSDTALTACYAEAAQSTEYSYVVFRDNITKDIHWSGDVEMIGGVGTVEAPAMLSYTGFTFVGWYDGDGNELTVDENGMLSVTKNTVVIATYKAKSETYTVTVDGTELPTKYEFGSNVTVTADEINENGEYFAGWYIGDTCVSMNAVYSFIITSDVSLTTRYTADKPEATPVVNLTVGDRVPLGDGRNTVEFNAAWSLPEGYTLTKAGIMYTVSVENADKLTVDNIGSSGIYNTSPVSTASEGNYGYTLTLGKNSSLRNLYVRAYITYMDAAGKIVTVYSGDAVMSPAGN